ncbi:MULTISPECIES: WhiB family transcriptional regulator [Kitasatospora]|uniref:WhiB family transcriptional regulator n=1 Tax=Kitasatospora TaxID=2063 RepID=UPI000C70068E|nr:WhiB family transcriptional regulator [Kitasatospora sp. GP30]MDH6143508.1 WhiB family redox-sensing transcriptional regulator [Kitasatospora sp. GP30]
MTSTSRLPGAFDHYWNWQLRAACRSVDTSLFFHPFGERGEAHDNREQAAKQVCARCPVRDACLSHALRVREPYGVWGGLTEDERAELLRPVLAHHAGV